jgi:hypothetical protein
VQQLRQFAEVFGDNVSLVCTKLLIFYFFGSVVLSFVGAGADSLLPPIARGRNDKLRWTLIKCAVKTARPGRLLRFKRDPVFLFFPSVAGQADGLVVQKVIYQIPVFSFVPKEAQDTLLRQRGSYLQSLLTFLSNE